MATKDPAWHSALRKWMPLAMMSNAILFAVKDHWLSVVFFILSYLALLNNEFRERERENSPTGSAAAPQA